MSKADPGTMRTLDPDVLARAIDEAGQAIAITDASPSILAVNKHFTEVTGYEASEVVGKNPSILQSGQQGETYYRDLWASLAEHGSWEGEIWNRRKSGRDYPQWMSIKAIRDDDGIIQNYVADFSDITSRKLTEGQLEDLAYFDPLTGLVNRRMFEDRLAQAIGLAKRGRQTGALMLIDLDGFKLVNDFCGHEAGDRVLVTISARIVGSMRDVDTVARIGGDEFTVLCPEIADRRGCEVLARRLMKAISEPIRLSAEECVLVDASIGISLFSADARDPKQVMQAADKAMYAVKAAGKCGYRFAEDESVPRGIPAGETREQIRLKAS